MGELYLGLEKYLENLSKETKMDSSKATYSPLDPGSSKADKGSRKFNDSIYRRTVGLLNYLSITATPDIAF